MVGQCPLQLAVRAVAAARQERSTRSADPARTLRTRWSLPRRRPPGKQCRHVPLTSLLIANGDADPCMRMQGRNSPHRHVRYTRPTRTSRWMIKVSGRRAERRFGRWLPTSLVISIAQAGHPQGTGGSQRPRPPASPSAGPAPPRCARHRQAGFHNQLTCSYAPFPCCGCPAGGTGHWRALTMIRHGLPGQRSGISSSGRKPMRASNRRVRS